MTFSVAHWIFEMINMQGKDIIEHTNGTCHVSAY